MTELDCVFTRKSTNSFELIWKFFHQVITGSDGLGCCCCRSGCRTLGVRLGNCDHTVHPYDC